MRQYRLRQTQWWTNGQWHLEQVRAVECGDVYNLTSKAIHANILNVLQIKFCV
jgi:hypothetical protein